MSRVQLHRQSSSCVGSEIKALAASCGERVAARVHDDGGSPTGSSPSVGTFHLARNKRTDEIRWAADKRQMSRSEISTVQAHHLCCHSLIGGGNLQDNK